MSQGAAPAVPDDLRPSIDRALSICIDEVVGEPRRTGLEALVSLRRKLFSADPDFQIETA